MLYRAMNLRNQVEWALHCVSVLASLPDDKYLAAQVLAEFHGIPKEYLAKALQELAKAGIIEGRLGPRGGYRLARPPHEITFLDVVQAIEGNERSFRCTEIRKNSPCVAPNQKFSPVCAIARVMNRADEAYRQVLREMTIADLSTQVSKQVPPETARKSLAWLLERAG